MLSNDRLFFIIQHTPDMYGQLPAIYKNLVRQFPFSITTMPYEQGDLAPCFSALDYKRSVLISNGMIEKPEDSYAVLKDFFETHPDGFLDVILPPQSSATPLYQLVCRLYDDFSPQISVHSASPETLSDVLKKIAKKHRPEPTASAVAVPALKI